MAKNSIFAAVLTKLWNSVKRPGVHMPLNGILQVKLGLPAAADFLADPFQTCASFSYPH